MEHDESNEPEPTLIDLAERLDSQGMVGFTRAFHNDLRQGFDAVNIERFPWLEELKQAPWSGVLCLGSPPTLEAHRRGKAVASPCVRRCDFTQALTVRLACPGHISWELRNAPHPGCYKY